MNVPRWDDPNLKAGTMVRGALWLVSEVGEGNIFTKEAVRRAFPSISQADRRIRDLRDYGWVIYSNTDDVTLKANEQRFVKAGIEVWKPEVRRAATAKTVTAKQREAVMAADDYQCVVCGIAGGETYLDSPNETAVLAVTRRAVRLPGGDTEDQLVTECKHCRGGHNDGQTADTARLLEDIRNLDDADRARLERWMRRGRRGATPLDRAWTQYRQLPAEARDEVLNRLHRQDQGH